MVRQGRYTLSFDIRLMNDVPASRLRAYLKQAIEKAAYPDTVNKPKPKIRVTYLPKMRIELQG